MTDRRALSSQLADDLVSPELALVDPVLAERERALLPERRPAPLLVEVRSSPGSGHDAALTALATAALDVDEHAGAAESRRRSWRLLVGVAASTIVALLLLDVHVDVGRTPAAAESTQSLATEATPSPKLTPAPTKPAVSSPRLEARRFAWAPVPGADGYHIEFFRDSKRVLSVSSTQPQVAIPKQWRSGGKLHALTPGEYQWYVWPVIAGQRATTAVVQAKLVVP
jgi:hypothetical protein